MLTPFANSYWVVPDKLLAGEYPRTKDDGSSRQRIDALLKTGITRFIDLTTPADGLTPYAQLLHELSGGVALRLPFPIPDLSVPKDPSQMRDILDAIDRSLCEGHGVLVHCWGGVGRTGTVVGCWLRRHFKDGRIVRDGRPMGLPELWRTCSKSKLRPLSPETKQQMRFVENWSEPEQAVGEPSAPTECGHRRSWLNT